MSNSTVKTLKQAIREKGLKYKDVAGMIGCPVSRVCSDAGLKRLSYERAVLYGRALGVDPFVFRPDMKKSLNPITNCVKLITHKNASASSLMVLPTDNTQTESQIYTIRGVQVMLDRDLAALYGVKTKAFNQAIKRNSERFPPSFMFQLNNIEFYSIWSQFVTKYNIKDMRGWRNSNIPHVFTEHGAYMLSAVLNTPNAVAIGIAIIKQFAAMRKRNINSDSTPNQTILELKHQLSELNLKTDKILNILEKKKIVSKHIVPYSNKAPIIDMLLENLDWNAPKSLWRDATCEQLLLEIAPDIKTTQSLVTTLGIRLHQMGLTPWHNGRSRIYLVPPTKIAGNDFIPL